MAKNGLSLVCQNCGAAYNRWQGNCESCGERNTRSGATTMPVSIRALETLTGKSFEAPRLPSGIAELDHVAGGGIVRGSV
jgi:DNA repair protein RadA/Sms